MTSPFLAPISAIVVHRISLPMGSRVVTVCRGNFRTRLAWASCATVRFLVVLGLVCTGISRAAPDAAVEDITYERDIRPILKAYCFHCHGEEPELQGGLDVRLRRLLIEGGDSGAVIVPGSVEKSLLYERISSGEMPPEGAQLRPTPEQIETIARWIRSGARTSGPEPESADEISPIAPHEREYWAFQPIRSPPVPVVGHPDRIRNPVDAYLLAELERQDLRFSSEADRRTLIRRATFDLTGLPPTPKEVEEFLADDSPLAYEHLIDRLLSSPRYGERWGRHWLDAAGYADSEGFNERDRRRDWAWKYRDYVVRALNNDMPFDQFIQEQLAGDELVEPPYEDLTSEEIDRLTATGFLRMAPDGTGSRPDDPDLARNQVVAETITVVSSSLLGLTVGCAQCHDHRFDPILQKDYYRLRAVFEPALDWKNWRTPEERLISLATEEQRRQAAELDRQAEEAVKEIKQKYDRRNQEAADLVFERELQKIPEDLRDEARAARRLSHDERTADQRQIYADYPSINVDAKAYDLSLYLELFEEGRKIQEELKEIQEEMRKVRRTFTSQKPEWEMIRATTENPGTVPTTYLFDRGDWQQPVEEVGPGDLTVLYPEGSHAGEIAPNDPDRLTTGRRLAYARRITDGTHPLVPRVIVNRVWMHHFGKGIVATPGDFGRLGESPSHPELLDWLASDFISRGWSLKNLHRRIMTSTAYRQMSTRSPVLDAVDPDNRLLGRMSIRRLEAEVVRDAILATSGSLETELFGKPIPVEEVNGEVVLASREGGEPFRRSLYVEVRRSEILSMLEAFDAPRMAPNCTLRTVSTVAPQALMLMNSEFILEEADRFAARVIEEAGDEQPAQIRTAWNLAYARLPTSAELATCREFLAEQTEFFRQRAERAADVQNAGAGTDGDESLPGPNRLALTSLCHVIFGSNQFVYVE